MVFPIGTVDREAMIDHGAKLLAMRSNGPRTVNVPRGPARNREAGEAVRAVAAPQPPETPGRRLATEVPRAEVLAGPPRPATLRSEAATDPVAALVFAMPQPRRIWGSCVA